MEIIPRPSPSQADIQQASLLENNAGQLGNGFSRQFSRMEADEQSLQSRVTGYQRWEKPNKEWIVKGFYPLLSKRRHRCASFTYCRW